MNPIVLGIDTSGTWCSAAVVHPDGVASRGMEVGNAHSDHLLAMIDAVLVEARLRLDECNCVAFGAGPGSFTGLRIACSVAQGMAFGAGVNVAPVGTLEAIAHSVPRADPSAQRMLVAMDARMGEVYWTLVDARDSDDGWASARDPALDTPAGLRRALGDKAFALGCGNAWSIHGQAMDGLVSRVVVRQAADAVDVARLGVRASLAGRLVAPADAAPLYVRNHVADTTREREAKKAAALVFP